MSRKHVVGLYVIEMRNSLLKAKCLITLQIVVCFSLRRLGPAAFLFRLAKVLQALVNVGQSACQGGLGRAALWRLLNGSKGSSNGAHFHPRWARVSVWERIASVCARKWGA